ncbi:MAG TPA: hypothetical protein DIT03_02685, partial [Candidatus Accumulibacter sp.]|nr:hypothetical protein [Accumulibacter sp.]
VIAAPAGGPAAGESDPPDVVLDADFNADGRGDLLQISRRTDGMAIARQWLASGSGFSGGEPVVLGAWLTGTRYLVGDVDGDGRSDLAEIRQAPGGPATVHTWLTTGSGLWQADRSLLRAYPADTHYTLGDTNGDGFADLTVHEPLADGSSRFSVWQRDGSEFRLSVSQDTPWEDLTDSVWLAVDVQADDLSDLVVVQRDPSRDANSSDSSTWLTIRDGRSQGISGQGLGLWAQHVALLASRSDGRDDLLRIWRDDQGALQVTLWRGEDDSVVAAATSPLGSPRPAQQFLAADVDGDLLGDIVQLWRDGDGRSVATVWRAVAGASGTQYGKQAETILGRKSDQAVWRLHDHDGDGRADLLASSRDAGGRPQIEAWLSDGRGFAGQTGWHNDLAWFDADFNGDGRRDLLQIDHRADGQAIARQWLATSDGFAEGDATELGGWHVRTRYLTGDLDADGRSDLSTIRQAADGRVVADTWLVVGGSLLHTGRSDLGIYRSGGEYRLHDNTGDGLADLLLFWQSGNDASSLTLWQGDGRTFGHLSDRQAYGADLLQATRLSLDLNGDRRTDFAAVQRAPWLDARFSNWSTWLTTWQAHADGSWRVAEQGIGFWEQHVALLAGSTTGDDRDDLLRVWRDDQGDLQLTVWRSNGGSFDDAGTSHLGTARLEQQFHAADVDGDGDSDFIQIWRDQQGRSIASTWRAVQAGEHFHYEQRTEVVLDAAGDATRWHMNDHNGDGRADLIGTWRESDGRAQVGVWHSDGSSFVGQNGWLTDLAWFAADFDADGQDDLFEVGHRSDGMAIGRQWFATAGGLTASDAVELGSWRAGSHYLPGDLDGDGRSA